MAPSKAHSRWSSSENALLEKMVDENPWSFFMERNFFHIKMKILSTPSCQRGNHERTALIPFRCFRLCLLYNKALRSIALRFQLVFQISNSFQAFNFCCPPQLASHQSRLANYDMNDVSFMGKREQPWNTAVTIDLGYMTSNTTTTQEQGMNSKKILNTKLLQLNNLHE